MKNKLSIKKVSITINVIKVDNHKMTKAVFNQIPLCKIYHDDGSCNMDKTLNLQARDIFQHERTDNSFKALGYVRIRQTNKWLLINFYGELFKTIFKNVRISQEIEQIYIAT